MYVLYMNFQKKQETKNKIEKAKWRIKREKKTERKKKTKEKHQCGCINFVSGSLPFQTKRERLYNWNMRKGFLFDVLHEVQHVYRSKGNLINQFLQLSSTHTLSQEDLPSSLRLQHLIRGFTLP